MDHPPVSIAGKRELRLKRKLVGEGVGERLRVTKNGKGRMKERIDGILGDAMVSQFLPLAAIGSLYLSRSR